jgi:hypothetical protein
MRVRPSRGAGSVGEELLGKPHCAERKADRLFDVLVLRERELATSAAEVDEQHAAAGSRLRAGDAEVNEAAFFQAGDDLHVPAGLGLDPGLKAAELRASRMAEVATTRMRSTPCDCTAR